MPRLALLMVGSVAALAGWLIVDHDLCETASADLAPERARLFNLVAALLLIDPGPLGSEQRD